MLINVEECKTQFEKLSTKELLNLSGDASLSEAELKILNQVLETRNDLIEPVEPGEKLVGSSRKKHHYLLPSRTHKWINLWAVILALPMLKIVGFSQWWVILITACIVWLLSSTVISVTGKLSGKMGVQLLPLIYFGAYYGVYSLLYSVFY